MPQLWLYTLTLASSQAIFFMDGEPHCQTLDANRKNARRRRRRGCSAEGTAPTRA